jgi:hypothetical protein
MDTPPESAAPSAAIAVPGSPDHEFVLKEFEMLRISIDNALAELRKLDRWVLLASAAFWAWVFSNQPAPSDVLIVTLPAAIVILFWMKTFVLSRSIDATARYLREYPERILGGEVDGKRFGFQTFFNSQRGIGKLPSNLEMWSWLYYAALLGMNVAVGLLVVWSAASGAPDAAAATSQTPAPN